MEQQEIKISVILWGFKMIEEFEKLRELAELKSLSNYSLENLLTDTQHKRMKELFNKYYGEIK